MIAIELPKRVLFRGQPLKGTVHITAESPKTARKIVITLLRRVESSNAREKSPYYRDEFIKALFVDKNVEITPFGKHVPFSYKIPEDALYTFDNGSIKITWRITASVKYGHFSLEPFLELFSEFTGMQSDFLKSLTHNTVFKEFVVLPHVLQSESPPVHVPSPVCKNFGASILRRPFRVWWYTGLSHKTSHVNMILKKWYSGSSGDLSTGHYPGDKIAGTLYFTREIHGDLKVYLVSSSTFKSLKTEEETLIAHTRGGFTRGSSFSFTFTIPETVYPTIKTTNVTFTWTVRAVIKRLFRFTNVVEQEIEVTPLIY